VAIVTPSAGSLRAYGEPIKALPKVLVFSVNNFNICERTGFRAPRYDPLVRDGYGWLVRQESREDKHPQENYRPLISKHAKGTLRHEPVGDETFITTVVTVDDL